MCNAEGTDWSACQDDLTPRPEHCTNGLDDDCNGQADDCAWSQTQPMKAPRHMHQAQVLPNHEVLVTGGMGLDNLIHDSAELYDPVSREWSYTGSMRTPRRYHTMTLLPNGKVLVAGGLDGEKMEALNSAEVYDPETGHWSDTGAMENARHFHTMTLLPNGKMLVAGGRSKKDGGDALDSAEVYDPETGHWLETGELHTRRSSHTATVLPDGKVLVAGGRAADGSYLDSSEVYDPVTGKWVTSGRMKAARSLHAAARLGNQVLVAGGEYTSTPSINWSVLPLDSSELYDPHTGKWSITAAMNTRRTNYRLLQLSSDRVAAVGGYRRLSGSLDGPSSAIHAEVYDRNTQTWTATAAMGRVRGESAAVVLDDGQVLVCGGYDNESILPPENLNLDEALLFREAVDQSRSPVPPGP
ncbi:Kelch repeat-containing protein [Pyxidicoccus fallax]